ncbi:MAG: tetratricopeptide repeat protein, partial [Spirochaetota bacterium]
KNAYTIAMKLKTYDAALGFSQKLYSLNPGSIEFMLPHIRALIANGKDKEAEALIAKALALPDIPRQIKSEVLYLAGLIQTNLNTKIEYLQSALFENLQNVEALIAISAAYENSGDFRKAYRYLKQAAALNPANENVNLKLKELDKLINK